VAAPIRVSVVTLRVTVIQWPPRPCSPPALPPQPCTTPASPLVSGWTPGLAFPRINDPDTSWTFSPSDVFRHYLNAKKLANTIDLGSGLWLGVTRF